MNIDIYDDKLRRHMPQEWFILPLDVIDSSIELIITEQIFKYRYDKDLEEIIEKQ